jgi:ankyrin repeat protein
VQEGDATIVDRLLSAKPNLANVKNDRDETPLKVAEKADNQELADTIRKHGGHE